MTRKKWNKLRRSRPELFAIFDDWAWETMSPELQNRVKTLSRSDAITALTAFRLGNPQYQGVEGPLDHRWKVMEWREGQQRRRGLRRAVARMKARQLRNPPVPIASPPGSHGSPRLEPVPAASVPAPPVGCVPPSQLVGVAPEVLIVDQPPIFDPAILVGVTLQEALAPLPEPQAPFDPWKSWGEPDSPR